MSFFLLMQICLHMGVHENIKKLKEKEQTQWEFVVKFSSYICALQEIMANFIFKISQKDPHFGLFIPLSNLTKV